MFEEIWEHRRVQAVLFSAVKVAATGFDRSLTGETETGKDLVARAHPPTDQIGSHVRFPVRV